MGLPNKPVVSSNSEIAGSFNELGECRIIRAKRGVTVVNLKAFFRLTGRTTGLLGRRTKVGTAMVGPCCVAKLSRTLLAGLGRGRSAIVALRSNVLSNNFNRGVTQFCNADGVGIVGCKLGGRFLSECSISTMLGRGRLATRRVIRSILSVSWWGRGFRVWGATSFSAIFLLVCYGQDNAVF